MLSIVSAPQERQPTLQTAPRTLYYGWIITGTLAITETISWGIVYYAFSVFITPMQAELGWSIGELTGAYSLALLIAGAMALPVGFWIDRHGARLLMTAGSIAASLLVVAWSQVQSLPALYLIWAGLGVCAAAVLYDPVFAVVAIWFERRRGRALALITFAAGLASTIFIPLSDALLRATNWRTAVLMLGVLLAVTTILPHALVLRRRPQDMGLLPDGDGQPSEIKQRIQMTLNEVVRSRMFWLLTAAFSLSNLASAAIRVHFIPFLIDVGVNASVAAWASGSIGLLQVFGRVLFAPLDSRLSSRVMTIGVFGLQALGLSLLLVGTSGAAIVIFIIVFGAAYGAKTLARPVMLADLYGSSHYARISSVMALFLTASSTVAPVGAGLLHDASGSYQPVLWASLAISLVSVAVMFFVRSKSPLDER
jgi:MFS family permease